MSDRDDDLDDLLRPLKETSPSDFQMQNWNSAVQRETRKSSRIVTSTKWKWALQLSAAMFVGIIIGAVSYKTFQGPAESPLLVQNSSADATFERSHANLD